MYPFRVKHLGMTEVYTLYTSSAQNRQDWCDKILEAKTRHAAYLYEQNAEPFKLRVMADTAFENDVTSSMPSKVILVKGTPLNQAIVDIAHRPQPQPAPVSKARVNCATVFHYHGKQIVAMGTDYGVYTSEIVNPQDWTRVSTSHLQK